MLILEGDTKTNELTITTDTETNRYRELEGLFIARKDFVSRIKDKNGNRHTVKADFNCIISYNHGEWFIRMDGPFGQFKTTYVSTHYLQVEGPFFFDYTKGLYRR